MLRFDVPPVWSNVIRWEAFVTHVLCWLALLLSPWFLALPIVQGLIKGFIGHYRCPMHIVWQKLFVARGWQGKRENAGAKMFAAKILFIAGAVGLTFYVAGSPMWVVPTGALVLFSFLEWAFSFCAACWAYGAWYQRFPPAGT